MVSMSHWEPKQILPLENPLRLLGKPLGMGPRYAERCALQSWKWGLLHEGRTCLIPILMLGAEMLKRIETAKCLRYSSRTSADS